MELMERRRILLNTPHINIVTGLQFVTDMVAPIESLVINFSPVQDLHGYDSPWPAGGGANLLPPHSLPSVTDHGITLTNNNGEYTLNGTTGSAVAVFDIRVSLPAGQYTLSVNNPTANSKVQIYGVDEDVAVPMQVLCSTANTTATATFAATVKIFRIRVLANGTVDNFKLSPVFSAGATAATRFSPYSNICPISGRTGIDVVRCGKNLYSLTDTIVLSKPEETGRPRAVTKQINPIPKGTYRFSGKLTTTNDTKISVIFQYYDRTTIAVTNVTGLTTDFDLSVTFSHEVTMVYVYIPQNQADGIATLSDIQIELGSTPTPTAYEPYQGTTYSISWQSQAGTVYGGTLDVTSGVLTVDRAMVDLGTLNYGINNHATLGQYFWCDVYNRNIKRAGDYGTTVYPSICSAFKCVPRNAREFVNNTYCFDGSADRVTQIQFKDSAYSDATSFKTAVSGVQLVYELATPQTYQLTPQQVLTLKGTNNLLSNSNGGMTVNYWTHLD